MDARRLIPVGAAVTALLVLAGLASHGRPLSPGSGTGPSATFFDYVATTLMLLAVALVVVVAYVLATDRAGGGKPRRGRWNLVSAIIMLAASALIAYGIANSKFERRLRQLEQRQQQRAGEPKPPPATVPAAPKNLRNPRFRWDELVLVLVIVGGIGTYFYVTRARRRDLRPLSRRRAVSQALDESLDDLRTDPDVRRAIIAAYARMERALAAAGLAREPAEAPFEYLERSLVELDTGAGAARRLTDLFERAKFSHHEPAESMRDEAIDALVAVRDDLRRPEPQPVTA